MLNSKACKTVLSLYQNHTKTIPKPYQKPMFFLCQIGFKNEPGLTSKSNQKTSISASIFFVDRCTLYTYFLVWFLVWFWCQTWFFFEADLASKNHWFLVWFWYGLNPNQNRTDICINVCTYLIISCCMLFF